MNLPLRQAVIECLRENGVTRDIFLESSLPVKHGAPMGVVTDGHEDYEIKTCLLVRRKHCGSWGSQVQDLIRDEELDDLLNEVEKLNMIERIQEIGIGLSADEIREMLSENN